MGKDSNQGSPPYSRWAFLFIAVLACFRLAYLAIVPLELVGDESYYWAWGQELAWGYLSKPPLIGWIMALAGWLSGDTAWGLRAFAVLFGTGTLTCVFLTARALFDARTGFFAMLLLALSPANAALNLLLTIDAPLVFFWSAALFLFWKTLHAPAGRRTGWALALIVALGLGFLAKQMMLVFLAFGLLFLLTERDLRVWLRKPGLWLAILVSLCFLLPPLWWNWQNDWVTFSHTGHHFQGGDMNLADFIGRLAGFLGTQAGLVGPVAWGLLVFAIWQGFRHLGKLARPERYLLLFGGPGLIVVLLMTIRQDVNPNWPAVFYLGPLILTTAWALQRTTAFSTPPERWLRRGIGLGLGLMLLLYAIPFLLPALGLKGSQIDPTVRLSGWREFAQEVEALRRGEDEILLLHGHRYHASELSFYLQGQPKVWLWEPVIDTQYGIWGLPEPCEDCPVLIINAKDEPLPEALTSRLIAPEPEKEVKIALGDKTRNYTLYRAEGWKEALP